MVTLISLGMPWYQKAFLYLHYLSSRDRKEAAAVSVCNPIFRWNISHLHRKIAATERKRARRSPDRCKYCLIYQTAFLHQLSSVMTKVSQLFPQWCRKLNLVGWTSSLTGRTWAAATRVNQEESRTVYLWTVWWWPCSVAGRSRWEAAREAGTRGDWPGARRWSWGSRGRTSAPPRPADSLRRWSPPAGRRTAEEAWRSAEAGGHIWGQREDRDANVITRSDVWLIRQEVLVCVIETFLSDSFCLEAEYSLTGRGAADKRWLLQSKTSMVSSKLLSN